MPAFVTLPGSNRHKRPNSPEIGPVDPAHVSTLTIRVRSEGSLADLEKIAYDLARQPLAKRKYLTHEQLERLHGASQADLDKVERYARASGLSVVHRSPAERSLVVKGKLRDLLAAFHAHVAMYDHSLGPYRGRTGAIEIPAELDGIISGIFGFDTRPKQRLRHRHAHAIAADGPEGGNGEPATKHAKRYNFPDTFEGKTLDGAGQTIALIQLAGGYRDDDLRLAFEKIGVPVPKISAVCVDRATNNPTTVNSDDREVMLDIQVAGAVAPAAEIVVYFGPNHGNKGFLDAISAAIHDKQHKPSVISISWGGTETSSDRQGIDAFHELFAAAAALGITVCAASGDHGVADQPAPDWDGNIHVDHPACDDLVLGCGGTQIQDGKDVVWNDGTEFDVLAPNGGGWASGGGISTMIPVPSYQNGVELPKSLVTKRHGRGVPDIAMSATNYYCRVDGVERRSGGTSAVAPLMAGLVARLNQAKKARVGFLNPFLYSHKDAGIVNDVVSGTNEIKDSNVGGYVAGPGWDACTGLGTPDGTAILHQLR